MFSHLCTYMYEMDGVHTYIVRKEIVGHSLPMFFSYFFFCITMMMFSCFSKSTTRSFLPFVSVYLLKWMIQWRLGQASEAMCPRCSYGLLAILLIWRTQGLPKLFCNALFSHVHKYRKSYIVLSLSPNPCGRRHSRRHSNKYMIPSIL